MSVFTNELQRAHRTNFSNAYRVHTDHPQLRGKKYDKLICACFARATRVKYVLPKVIKSEKHLQFQLWKTNSNGSHEWFDEKIFGRHWQLFHLFKYSSAWLTFSSTINMNKPVNRKTPMNRCAIPHLSLEFGAAFEPGLHEWFALRRLITNSRTSALSGGFWSRFL